MTSLRPPFPAGNQTKPTNETIHSMPTNYLNPKGLPAGVPNDTFDPYDDDGYWRGYSATTGESSPATTSGKSVYRPRWWERDAEEVDLFDTRRYTGRSVSSANSYLGLHARSLSSLDDEWADDDNGKAARLKTAGAEIARVLNAVLNSKGGSKEASLVVGWADPDGKKRNTPHNGNTIYLSPDEVIGKSGRAKSKPEAIDGLSGYGLMHATLKRTVSVEAMTACEVDRASTSPSKEANEMLWQSIEVAHAKHVLLRDWPGAAAYLARHHQMALSSVKEAAKMLDDAGETIGAATAALAWNIANPTQKIRLKSTKINDLVDELTPECLSRPPKERYNAAVEAIKRLTKALTEFEEEDDGGGTPPPGEEPGEDPPPPGGDGTPGDGTPPPPAEKPAPELPPVVLPPGITPVDPTMFGEKINSAHKCDDTIDVREDTEREAGKPPAAKGCSVPKKVYVIDARKDPKSGGELSDETKSGESSDDGEEFKSSRVNHRDRYQLELKMMRQATAAIVSMLRFRCDVPGYPDFGVRSGELDDGSLHKLVDRKDAHPGVFQRAEVISAPDVAIAILVDHSGSMTACGGKPFTCPIRKKRMQRARYVGARMACIAMAEAFRMMSSIKLHVFGHEADMRGHNTLSMIEYLSPGDTNHTPLGKMYGSGNNLDGFAIQYVLSKLAKEHRNVRQKYVFHLSDGMPHADGYGGPDAMAHVRDVCRWGKKRFGIRTFGIGIDGAPTVHSGTQMYGEGNFVLVDDVLTSATTIARFLASAINKR